MIQDLKTVRSDTKTRMEQYVRNDISLNVIYKDIRKDLDRVERRLKTFSESDS